jgi:hypothetical protein
MTLLERGPRYLALLDTSQVFGIRKSDGPAEIRTPDLRRVKATS